MHWKPHAAPMEDVLCTPNSSRPPTLLSGPLWRDSANDIALRSGHQPPSAETQRASCGGVIAGSAARSRRGSPAANQTSGVWPSLEKPYRRRDSSAGEKPPVPSCGCGGKVRSTSRMDRGTVRCPQDTCVWATLPAHTRSRCVRSTRPQQRVFYNDIKASTPKASTAKALAPRLMVGSKSVAGNRIGAQVEKSHPSPKPPPPPMPSSPLISHT
eukprot:342749-Chlamydomonas_euryale.AAC.1